MFPVQKLNKRMSKSKSKKDNIKSLVVKQLADEFEVTPQFVNMALREERQSDCAQKIKKEFKKKHAAIEAALN